VKIQVKLFAAMRQRAGADSVTLDFGRPVRVRELRRALIDNYPALAEWEPHWRIALDLEFADDEELVQPESEVAIIPPVSGG
jgi:molybdopterin converting factor subunit 1